MITVNDQVVQDIYDAYLIRTKTTSLPDFVEQLLKSDIVNAINENKSTRDERLNEIIESHSTLVPELPTITLDKPYGIIEGIKEDFITAIGVIGHNIVSGLAPVFGNIINDVYRLLEDKIFAVDEDTFESVFSVLKSIGLFDDDGINNLRTIISKFPDHKMIALFFLITSSLTGFVQGTMSIASARYVKNMNSKFSPAVPDSNSMIRGAMIAPEKHDQFVTAMKEAGLSDNDIELMFIANYNVLSPEIIRVLYLRDIISENKVYEYLREQGFTDTRINELIQTWEVIPPISDIIWMLGKEAFEEDQVTELGLDSDFPTDAVPFAKANGLNQFWLKRYWRAHWDVPSIQQGFEMLHRRVITDDQIDILFKAAEIPPFWRDKLLAIAYQPLTRVDVRRMYEDGVLDDEALFFAYLDQGYSRENAELMTEWTIKYTQRTEIKEIASQIEQMYKDGIMNESEAINELTDIGLKESEVDFKIQFWNYEISRENQELNIKLIGQQFQENVIDETEAISKLTNLQLDGTRIDYLLEKWNITRVDNVKHPSKTDLDKFFRNGIIDLITYQAEMEKLGYGKKYISWYSLLLQK